MKDMLRYQDYFGSVHFSDEDNVFCGRIEFIRALVSYEGTEVATLRQAFREAVEDYVQTCDEQGRTPEKPFKGSFNVRITPKLHRRIATSAASKNHVLAPYEKLTIELQLTDRCNP